MSEGGAGRAVRMVVAGRVQGVGFRYFTRQAAAGLGLVGWVRNLASGEVEVQVAGPPEKLEAFRGRLRHGPAGSRVDSLIEAELASTPDWTDFRITF